MTKRRLKIALAGAAALTLLIAGAAGWVYDRLQASLPDLEGQVIFDSLKAPVRIERDRLGIPSIHAENRLDAARATGFVHAQDRFFQMDFMRRDAAGELSAILGGAMTFPDRRRRLHGFRPLARTVFPRLPQEQQDLFSAYAEGVNQGLQALGAKPFEYYLLRAEPQPWLPEDCLMTVYYLHLKLKGGGGRDAFSLSVMKRLLPDPVFRFFTENGSAWESTLDGSRRPLIDVPEDVHFGFLREASASAAPAGPALPADPVLFGGGNAWALSADHASTGSSLLANDFHLPLAVPNAWYRADLHYGQDGDGPVRVTGATLPGLPFVLLGSNGHLAWAFTSAFVDDLDLIIVERAPEDPRKYLTPEGPVPFQARHEAVEIKGVETMHQSVRMTNWGPAFAITGFDNLIALKWAAHESRDIDLGLHRLETLRDVESSFQVLNRLGTPALHWTLADSNGTAGYTLSGYLVDRENFDGQVAVSMADGSRVWKGRVEPQDYPRIVGPEGGRIWSGSQRPLGPPWRRILGKGSFVNGARAWQIHHRLEALQEADEEAMMEIQMDTEAFFLERWRQLALRLLQTPETAAFPEREALEALLHDWQGRAGVEAAGYHWVRAFRDAVARRVLTRILRRCFETYDRFDYAYFDYEEPLWLLITQQTQATADLTLQSWDAELALALQEALSGLRGRWGDLPPRELTWGKRNEIRFQHLLSPYLPLVGLLFDLPPQSLPGDQGMPAFMTPGAGPSQRMVVSPGSEQSGIFHMPGGQSGHPLSPHYSDGHQAWTQGEPTPFLPGEPVHVLHLLNEER